jgi:hypothetical protein
MIEKEQFEFCIAYPVGLGIAMMIGMFLPGEIMVAKAHRRVNNIEYFGASFLGLPEEIARLRALVNNFFDQAERQVNDKRK